jgi:integrase
LNNWIAMRGPSTKLAVLIDDYEKAAEAGTYMSRPLSPHTIRGYGKALRELDRLLGAPTLSGLTLEAVAPVIVAKARKSKSSARLSAAVAKTFSTWLYKAGRTPANTLKELGTPKFNGRRRAFSDVELKSVLRALRTLPNKTRKRDLAIVLLAIGSGLRSNEIRQLAQGDAHITKPLSDSWAYIRWDTSKSEYERRVRIAEDAAAAIHDYIASDRADKDGPLFLRSDGAPFSYEGWGKMFGRIGDELEKQGVKRFGAHLCRHEWATLGARAGMTQPELCQEGGWARGSRVPSVYIDEIPFEELQRKPSPMTAYLRRVS